jgi:hypothetical protein
MSIEVYKPLATRHSQAPDVAEARSTTEPAAPRSIAGATFAVLHNHWQAMYRLTDAIADRLIELGASDVLKLEIPTGGYPEGASQQASPRLLDMVAGRAGGAVFGLGN